MIAMIEGINLSRHRKRETENLAVVATKKQIIEAASGAIFGKPLVVNVYRSVLVEAMIASALPDWEWCSTDYASYDFRRDGVRLEVKQTALRQTWSKERLSRPSWDIAERTGYWENGTDWFASPGRNADIYVLGLHNKVDASADHRDPDQWSFFVISAGNLPAQKRIGIAAVSRLAELVRLSDLSEAIDSQMQK